MTSYVKNVAVRQVFVVCTLDSTKYEYLWFCGSKNLYETNAFPTVQTSLAANLDIKTVSEKNVNWTLVATCTQLLLGFSIFSTHFYPVADSTCPVLWLSRALSCVFLFVSVMVENMANMSLKVEFKRRFLNVNALANRPIELLLKLPYSKSYKSYLFCENFKGCWYKVLDNLVSWLHGLTVHFSLWLE